MARTTEALTATDGTRVSLEVYYDKGHEAALIICPGFMQSKETPTFQRMAETFAGEYDVLNMDFRGHGRSSGLYTFSAKEGADLEAVLAWAQPRYPHLGIMGFSMGGAIAINTASRHPGAFQALVAVSAPCIFEEIEFKFWTPEAMRTGLDGLEPGAGCRPGNPLMAKPRPLETIRAFQNLPVFFVHGTNDMIVSHWHSERLFAVAPEPKRLQLVEGGSHAEALFRDDPEGFARLVQPWVTRTLARTDT